MVIFFSKRNKICLINGLGNIIRSITGNLDSQDGERYDQMFDKIKENQKIIQKQNLDNIELNKGMIEKFNKQVEDLSHSEIVLQGKIIQISSLLNKQLTYESLLLIKHANKFINYN